MTIQKKAFRPIYRAIQDKQLTVKEAYDVLCGIFNVEYIPVSAPTFPMAESSTEQTPQTDEITVKGFCNG